MQGEIHPLRGLQMRVCFFCSECLTLQNRKHMETVMTGQPVEIYICEEGGTVLFQSIPELKELMEEIGKLEFGFNPYCG
jgi:hypothetical protein